MVESTSSSSVSSFGGILILFFFPEDTVPGGGKSSCMGTCVRALVTLQSSPHSSVDFRVIFL